MRRCLMVILMFLVFVGFSFSKDNLAPITKGGSMDFKGVCYGHKQQQLFDDDPTSAPAINVEADPNNYVDRIWESRVKIEEIQLKTTDAQKSFEYKFFCWDLENQEWKELINVTGNQDTWPRHIIKPPVVTNKIRYSVKKAGPDGKSKYNNVYQFYYLGEFIEGTPPNEVQNVQVQQHETGFVKVVWGTPLPNKDGELPAKYNIYRSKVKDIKAIETNLVAEGITGNQWVDVTAKAADGYYYAIQSVGQFGEMSKLTQPVYSK